MSVSLRFLFLLACLPFSAFSGVVINELMYHPFEPFGTTNRSEFVEVYNDSATSVDLSTYRFDNGVDFEFSAGTMIGPGQYLVVCEDLAVFGTTYPGVTNVVGPFSGSLDNGGERVTLSQRVDGTWETVDTLRYIDDGLSDGDGHTLELIHPGFARLRNQFMDDWLDSTGAGGTPGAINSVFDASPHPVVGDVSHEPPLGIPGGIVTVRARVAGVTNDVLQSVTLEYRLDKLPQGAWQSVAMRDTGNRGDRVASDGEYAAEIPPNVVSAAGDRIEFRIVAVDQTSNSTTAPTGSRSGVLNGLYSYLVPFVDDPGHTGEHPTFHMVMTGENRNELQTRGTTSSVLLDCTFITASGEIFYNCGIRYRGLSSRVHPFNYRIEFPKGQKFMGFQETNFNHKEPLLQHMGHRLLARSGNGVVAPETRLVRLWLNESLRSNQLTTNGGGAQVYVMVEKIDHDFVAKHFDDATGNIYRGDRDGNLQLNATIPQYQDDYIIDIGNPNTAWHSLTNLTGVLAEPLSQYPTVLSNRVNVMQWAQSYASNVAIENSEGGLLCARSTTGDDYYMYAEPITGQFHFLPWDMDSCIDSGRNGVSATRSMWQFESNNRNASAQVAKFLTNPPIAPLYIGFLQETLNTSMSEAAVEVLFEEMGSAISESYKAHLRNDLATRRASLRSQINTNFTVSMVNASPHDDSLYFGVNSTQLSMSGVAPQAFTTAIEVNGQPANWSSRQGVWSMSIPLVLSNVVNDVRIEAVDGGEELNLVVIRRNNIVNAGTAITTPTVWSNPGGIVYVNADVTIFGGGSLSVAAGTVLTLADGVTIRANGGNVELLGTESNPVWILPEEQGDQWVVDVTTANAVTGTFVRTKGGRFTVQSGGSLSLFDSRIEGDGGSDDLLSLDGASWLELQRSRFINYATISLTNTPALIEQCVFEDVSNTALSFDSSVGITSTVSRSTFRSADGFAATSGISLVGDGGLFVSNCQLNGFTGHGIRASGHLEVSHCLIKNCVTGIQALPGGSFVNQHNTMFECRIGVTAARAPNVYLQVPEQFLPGQPVLVRVELQDYSGEVLQNRWDATATLSASIPGVTLSDSTIPLVNGLGSKLITISSTQEFDLIAEVDGMLVDRTMAPFGATATNTVSGTLLSGGTWSNVVHVTDDVVVPAGQTLTILPGTMVLLDGVVSGTAGTDIDVLGRMLSLGTEKEPVTFTAIDQTEAWGEIHLDNAASTSEFYYTSFSRTGRAPGGGHTGTGPTFRVAGSDAVFEHCSFTDLDGKVMQATAGSDLTFRHCEMARAVTGPEVDGTAVLVEDSWIYEMRGVDDNDGIYLHDQQPGQELILRRLVVAGVDDDGIDTLGATVSIEDCIVRDAADKGVSVFGDEVFIDGLISANNDIGISVKATGTSIGYVHLNQSTFIGNNIGLQARNKSNQPNVDLQYFVTNCIVEAGPAGGADPVQTDYDPADIHIEQSDVGEVWPGTGNIQADPDFRDAAANDYHIASASSPAAAMGALPYIPNDGPVSYREVGSIVWGTGSSGAISGEPNFSYSLIRQTPFYPGVQNIYRDPRFRSVADDDFRLRADSPAIAYVPDGLDAGPLFPVGANPAAPEALMLSHVLPGGTSQVDLTWGDYSDQEHGVELQRSRNEGAWDTLILLGPDEVHYVDSDVLPGDTVAYRVRSFHERGTSYWAKATITIGDPTPSPLSASLRLSEIMYNPANSPGDVHEYLELQNIGSDPIDLSGAYFENGIDYVFSNGTTMVSGDYLVLVRDPIAFAQRYPGVAFHGQFQNGTALSDGGERIRIKDAVGNTVLDVTYDGGENPDWYPLTDGAGYALVLANPDGDLSRAAAWRRGSAVDGSPGALDPAVISDNLVINEIMYNPAASGKEFVELLNISSNNVDVGGWFFGAGVDYTFAAGTSLLPGERVLITSIAPEDFRRLFALPSSLQVLGPFEGALNNGGERLALFKATETNPKILVDDVSYLDRAPWPVAADNGGASLERIDPSQSGHDPANWIAATFGGTPGETNNVFGLPTVSFSRTSDSIVEGEGAATVDLLFAGNSDITAVQFSVGGTALGSDRTISPASGVNFYPDETNKTVSIEVADDGSFEFDEIVVISIDTVSAGVRVGGNNSYTLTIVDNDGSGFPAPQIQLSDPTVFTNLLVVTIVNTTPGTELFYTLDGSVPTRECIPYLTPFLVDRSVNIRAREYKGSENASAVDSVLALKQLSVSFVDDDGDGLDDAWERFHFLSTNVTNGGTADQDDDDFTDFAEMVAGSDPNDPTRRLELGASETLNVRSVTWQSEPGHTYTLQRATSASGPWLNLATSITADPPQNVYFDNSSMNGRQVYRVIVEP